MNILRLTQIPPASAFEAKDAVARFGLVTTHLFPLSRELEKSGIKSFFFSGGGMRTPREETVQGFPVVRTRAPSKPLFFPYGWALERKWNALQKKWGKIDIIHAHNPHYAYGLASFVNQKKIPLVITIHGTFPYKEWEKPFLRRVFRAARGVIAINQPSVEEALSFGVSRDKIHLIHTGVDTSFFYPKKVKKENSILYVGRLVGWKKVDVLIRAFAQLPEEYKTWKLDVVGSGPAQDKLEELVKSLHLSARARFHGEVSQAQLAELYSRSRVTVVPHEVDSFGKTVIESLACATPIVGTDHDIPPTIRVGGWFYSHQRASEPQQLTQTLVSALESGELEKRGKKGMEVVERNFTWKRVAEQNQAVYENILKK